MPAKIQVIFYSMYGHVYQMAEAVADGARDTGDEVSLWQVPELVPDEVLERAASMPPARHPPVLRAGTSRRSPTR
jgi:NAD(P)H dehydrogenase (quinone)